MYMTLSNLEEGPYKNVKNKIIILLNTEPLIFLFHIVHFERLTILKFYSRGGDDIFSGGALP